MDVNQNDSELIEYHPVFYCQKCRNIPQITTINPELIEIDCTCNNKRTYTIQEFLTISNQKLALPKCEGTPLNNTCENEAESYCPSCSRWLCSEHSKVHNNFHNDNEEESNTYIFNDLISNGIQFSFKCEDKTHSSMNIYIDYFCTECRQHICKDCLKKHKAHKTEKISKINENINISTEHEELDTISNDLNKIANSSNCLLSDLTNTLLHIKESINKNFEINRNLILFYQVLINDYISINGKNNYYAIMNLINNKLSLRLKKINIMTEFGNSLNLLVKFFDDDILLKTPNWKSDDLEDDFNCYDVNESLNIFKNNEEDSKSNNNKCVNISYKSDSKVNDNLVITTDICNIKDNSYISSNNIKKQESKPNKNNKKQLKNKSTILNNNNNNNLNKNLKLDTKRSQSKKNNSKISITKNLNNPANNKSISDIPTTLSSIYKLTTLNSFTVTYKPSNIKEAVKLFNPLYKNFDSNNSEISIDGKIVPFTNKHTFKTKGTHSMTLTCKTKVSNLSWLFYECEDIVKVDMSKWSTKPENISAMFCKCKNLSSVCVSEMDVSEVEDMSLLFSVCSSIKSIDVEKWAPIKCKDFSYMFGECKSLSLINISKWRTVKAEKMEGMFCKCENLKNLNLNDLSVKAVTNMSRMFYECKSLYEINVAKWDVAAVKDFSKMFSKCYNLNKVNISSWNINKTANKEKMFNKCDNLSNKSCLIY